MDPMLGHLISFYNDPDPKILFWKKDEVQDLELMRKDVSFRFSDYLLCTGYKTEGMHCKCPNLQRGKKQCSLCREKDISRIYTRLDFTGYGHLEEKYKKQRFSVYLAAFGPDIVKCGVTRTERVKKRLYEQGADYWCELMRFDDGEAAYSAEVQLQGRFGLKNFVRNDTKLKLLETRPSPLALQKKLDLIASCDDISGRLNSTKIEKNDFNVPEKIVLSDSLEGRITGSKANILFFCKGQKDFAYPMHKNIGRVFMLEE